jgi:hypothetical protein
VWTLGQQVWLLPLGVRGGASQEESRLSLRSMQGQRAGAERACFVHRLQGLHPVCLLQVRCRSRHAVPAACPVTRAGMGHQEVRRHQMTSPCSVVLHIGRREMIMRYNLPCNALTKPENGKMAENGKGPCVTRASCQARGDDQRVLIRNLRFQSCGARAPA